jgi:hypothetical protein
MQSLIQEIQQAMQAASAVAASQKPTDNNPAAEPETNPQGDVVEGEFKEA